MSQILLPFMVLPLFAISGTSTGRLLWPPRGSVHARRRLRPRLPAHVVPGMMAGSLMVFVLSLGFYLTPAILGSPQNSLLSQLISPKCRGCSTGGTRAPWP